MTEDQKKIADMQRLCERAYYILSENWDNYTDQDGYGPSSLLTDLKKVMDGKEYRDLRLMNEKLLKMLSESGRISG